MTGRTYFVVLLKFLRFVDKHFEAYIRIHIIGSNNEFNQF